MTPVRPLTPDEWAERQAATVQWLLAEAVRFEQAAVACRTAARLAASEVSIVERRGRPP